MPTPDFRCATCGSPPNRDMMEAAEPTGAIWSLNWKCERGHKNLSRATVVVDLGAPMPYQRVETFPIPEAQG